MTILRWRYAARRYDRRQNEIRSSFECLESRLLLSTNSVDLFPAIASADPLEPGTAEFAAALDTSPPSDAPPVFHSLPGAEAKVFLDFDGNWESSWGGSANVLTPPFDVDGDPTQFNADEQRRIHEAWTRVAEDFAPFNIDVTTEDPADASTMLRQALTVSQRTRTFYFRHQFNVVDASKVSALALRLLRDDGAAVYLNGTEVARDNLATDAQFDDFASSSVSGNAESTLQSFTIDPSLLVDGDNLLAVEVHQSSDTSSDVSFDLSLAGTIAEVPNTPIVDLGSSWSYLDDGSDQGVAWRTTDFDDSAWPVDRAEFGYGDSDEVSTLSARPEGEGRTRTFYFRHEFDVSNPDDFSELAIGLLRDDGAAVYLNGEEILRDNLRTNADFDDFASSSAGGDEESTFFAFDADAELLQEGRNVLAVEVHQSSDTSSDVSFDFELMGAGTLGGELSLVEAGADWKYLDDGSDQGTAWRESVFDDQSWSVGTAQFGYGDAPGTVHVAIGTEDWYEDSAGGVAFINSFDSDDRAVVYAFTNGFGPSGKNIAEVSSHEAGHAFGLRHQSVYDPDTGEKTTEYNPGQGDWAPIMGNSYSPARTTWHDGPVGSQGNPQDDMSVLARNSNGFGYRDDDHGNSRTTASPLLLGSTTRIDASGIIERNADRDLFAFALTEGQAGISIAAEGATFGANLDVVLEIRDQDNEVVAMHDPNGSYNASIDTELEPGDYTVVVRSNGDYGRVGQYTLTGNVDEPLELVELEAIGLLAPSARASREFRAIINFVGDRDSFSVFAQQGEMLTAVVTPSAANAALTVNIAGVGESFTSERGQSVTLPLTAISEDGTYQIDVVGSRATDYTIEIGSNLLFEAEDTNAQSMLALSGASAGLDRLTVLGKSEKTLETTSLIGPNAVWQYLDDGTDQANQWQEGSFDDSDWKSARGEFGYGDNDERTDVDEDGTDGQRIRTFYFRQQFEIADIAGLDELLLELKFDDGMGAYLNGQEIASENLSSSAGYRDFANGTINNEGDYREFVFDPAMLQLGNNVLAIEVHQASDTSSDVSMDARLNLTQQRAAVDSFTFDVSATDANQPLSIFLQGRGVDFRDQNVEILTMDGQTELASTEQNDSTAYDLAILSWVAPSAGTYIARVTSSAVGSYALSVGRASSEIKPGDSNFDGKVDFADFLVLSASFGNDGTWSTGDFDGDGIVAFSDFLLLSSNFGSQTA